VSVGGTISGEHGVGLEKRDAMRLMFSETDLDLMRRIRSAFDPAGICNPGKLVPEAAHDAAAPVRQVGLAVAPPIAAAEPLADPQNEEDVRALVATARASRTRLLPTGSGLLRHLAGSYADGAVPVRSTRMCGLGPVSPADTLITCGAGTPFAELQSALTEARQWVPLDPPSPETATVGGIVASNVTGLLRCSYGAPGDWAVRLRAVTGDGRVVTTGARVVKNAAGYDVGRLLAGSDGSLAFITEITFKTRPRPPEAAELAFRGPTADAANRFAWEVSQQHPQLEAVAVLGGPDPRVLVMLAGNRAAVERQAQSVGHLAAASGLDPTSSSGLADAARARLWALETDAAVRVSSGPFDAYGQAQLFSQAGFHYCWQVGCGLTVVDAGAGGADRLAHHLQTILPPQATYRWLRAPAGARVHDRRYASAEAAAIARRLKSAMDPDGVFPQTPHDSVAPRYATEAGGHA
jgi:FAD/FMN-containing dehydrogenase